MLRVKQGDIKYHFVSLWYDSTWDLAQEKWPHQRVSGPFGWLYRIHQQHLSREVRLPNESPDMTLNYLMGMLEIWGMQSTPSLPSLPSPLWPGVVALDRVLSIGEIGLYWAFILNWIVKKRTVFDTETLLALNWFLEIGMFWHLTVCKQKLYLY